MSNLVAHAARELDLIGMTAHSDEMNREMRNCILEVVETFAKQGHSGMSAAYALSLIKDLLAFKPISPLTGADYEWNEVSEVTLQNNRCSSVFKSKTTGEVYDIDGIVFEDSKGHRFTSINSRVPVTFPYTPGTQILKVST